MKKNKGFTLIELLVVIAIIGILSSVVLASLNSARQKSRDARRVSDIKQLQLAFELYFDSCGEYPATLATTAANGCTGSTTFADFMSSIPTPPSGSGQTAYDYAVGASNVSYHLGAVMEDTSHSALPGADSVLGFKGASVDCGAIVGSPDACYDVIP